jgi:thymidylate synthase (FAD)
LALQDVQLSRTVLAMIQQVRLIAITKPVIPECENFGDLLAYCARVSNSANQANRKTLRYLVRNQHWSPFEMASMTLEITTTRDIARQILRHRSFSFQEFSQRYAQAAPPVLREARMQDAANRQASNDTEDMSLKSWWLDEQRRVADMAVHAYWDALSHGIAKEVARSVLPEGMTKSVLYMAGTIRSWIHYCQLRTETGTQKEHREVALACRGILLEQFPALGEVLDADARSVGDVESEKFACTGKKTCS